MRRGAGRNRDDLGAARARAQAQLGFQLLYRAGTKGGQARVEALRRAELRAPKRILTLFGVQLRLHIVRFGAVGTIGQHLGNHLLCLIEMAGCGRLVNLIHCGISRLRKAWRPHSEGRAQAHRSSS